MLPLAKVLTALILVPLARATPTPSPDSGAHDYAQVAAIISQNCGGCHTEGGHKGGVRLDTEPDLLASGAEVLATIQTGRMPPRDPDFADSPAGQAVIAYLQATGTLPPGDEPPRGRCRRHHGDDDGDDFTEHHRRGCDD